MRSAFLAVLRCEAVVYRRDRLAILRGSRRFALIRSQCLRRHAKNSRFCWQHARAAGAKP